MNLEEFVGFPDRLASMSPPGGLTAQEWEHVVDCVRREGQPMSDLAEALSKATELLNLMDGEVGEGDRWKL